MVTSLVNSWSVAFLMRQRQYMSLASALRYRRALLRQRRNRASPQRLMKFRMHRPFIGDIWLRELGSDEDTFKEVVVKQVYGHLLADVKDCQYVMDLGANIGFASRLFAAAYP